MVEHNSKPSDAETPDAKLATIIADALYAAQLVASERKDSVKQKLAIGRVKVSDWRTWAEELVSPKEAQGGNTDEDL